MLSRMYDEFVGNKYGKDVLKSLEEKNKHLLTKTKKIWIYCMGYMVGQKVKKIKKSKNEIIDDNLKKNEKIITKTVKNCLKMQFFTIMLTKP